MTDLENSIIDLVTSGYGGYTLGTIADKVGTTRQYVAQTMVKWLPSYHYAATTGKEPATLYFGHKQIPYYDSEAPFSPLYREWNLSEDEKRL